MGKGTETWRLPCWSQVHDGINMSNLRINEGGNLQMTIIVERRNKTLKQFQTGGGIER